MNDKIVKGMVERFKVMDYASLKSKEEEILAQLKEVREEIKKAEEGIVAEKLDTAVKCLKEVEELTNGYYNYTMEKYCGNCENYVDINFDLSDIITVLQQTR